MMRQPRGVLRSATFWVTTARNVTWLLRTTLRWNRYGARDPRTLVDLDVRHLETVKLHLDAVAQTGGERLQRLTRLAQAVRVGPLINTGKEGLDGVHSTAVQASLGRAGGPSRPSAARSR